ncbi:plastocyanin/azurin family copper-binding protein [Pseudoroseomonas cervicalis]|uniref:Putative pseudoazurin n=1 Tax=Pseudoroseomonas cervicalis ATCC 49957 TaxID=525371 RepID=D5RQS2_9PROT|nr:plastocyanin/azurin family copper-binding protein [Pseudoroseomonas cervicalis]EFH10322.1 putative pseudoazurin [Pseudoroseomonas cervicalis ATCC 49957]
MTIRIALAALAVLLATGQGAAAEPAATVRELNRGPVAGETFAYDPALVRIPVGGAVRFEPTDKGHNVTPIQALWPAGAPSLNVPFNAEATVTFDSPGVYPVQCTPHTGLGMVALIVVGDADMNEFAAKAASAPGLAPKARAKLGVLAGAAGRP